MSEKRFVKLVMCTELNNNKFYTMEWDGISSNFNVEYGRVEKTCIKESHPINKWNIKYNEKLKKGYKDVTHTVAVKVVDDKPVDDKLGAVEEAKVEQFLSLMKRYTDNLVKETYTVKKQDVTQQQVDNAQRYLSELGKLDKTDVTGINNKLLELYMEIPRYMSNVKDHLLPRIKLENVLQQEQDNLDAMAAQVKMLAKQRNVKKKSGEKRQNIMDVLGIQMKEIKSSPDLDYLVKQLSGRRIEGIFEVNKEEEDVIFEGWLSKQKNKTTRILIHGTRCTSVIPILEIGLKIRPPGNYQFSGKAYGNGNYFSETCVKSLGYTGNSEDKVLLVYEVHVGNPFVYDGWYRGNSFPLTYPELQKRGFDSTFVKAGNGLLNSEIIAYNEEQCRIRYVIWLK